MKKLMIMAFALTVLFSFSACGGKDTDSTTAGDSGDIDLNAAAENLIDEAIEGNAFSEAAAMQALGNRGVEKASVEPDWAQISSILKKNRRYKPCTTALCGSNSPVRCGHIPTKCRAMM
jgi:hypothetical protein